MASWIRDVLGRRPAWMNLLMFFSAYMAFVYVPWDLFFKPVARDQEVWFGILFQGWAAKLLEIPHWFVYAAGTYGFWRMRPWMHPWAALYVAQIAIGMGVWSVLELGGLRGWVYGILPFALFMGLTLALWRARPHFGRRRASLADRYGGWALVTGASAGIGAEFARALAREGLAVVLTARREDRLRELAAELERGFGVETRVVAVDLGEPSGTEQLARAVEDLDIGLLVNNAGVGYSGRFAAQDVARLRSMVTLNCVVPVVLTRLLLPRLQERGRGGIVITGSVAGRQALPLHAVYSATKAFDQLLGESLWAELRGTGIDVLVLEPGSTESEFHAVAGELPHPGQPVGAVVRTALDALGQQPSVVSGWFNWLRATATRLLPRTLLVLLAQRVTERVTPTELR